MKLNQKLGGIMCRASVHTHVLHAFCDVCGLSARDTHPIERRSTTAPGLFVTPIIELLRRQILSMVAGLLIAAMSATPCWAVDYQPFDFVPAAPGTIMIMGYSQYGTRNELDNTITGTVKSGTHLESQIGIFRPLYYNQVFGHPYLLEFLLPFGTLYNGKINGTRLNNSTGLGDLILSGTFWPISLPEQKTWFSVSNWVTVPSGTYHKGKPLNLGANRYQNDVQLNVTQGIGKKFTFDVSFDWIHYWDNTEAGTGHQTLSQHDTYNVYNWVSYDISDVVRRALPSLGAASVSVGYAGTFGGVQRLSGVRTGSKTSEHQIRFTYEQFVTPTWQALLSFNHDVKVSGQFKQNFGMVFRVAKVFSLGN